MADIELVIKIPEIEYEHLTNKEKFYSLEKNKQEWLINKILNRVIDGTPLPKGHGRLMDENDLRYFGICTNPKFDGVENLNDVCSQDCGKCIYFAVNLSNISTIIEADKSESEG